MGFKKKEIKYITRESICIALLALLNESDFDKITITEICEKAGTSRVAFYRNFVDKEDVINSVIKKITSDIVQGLTDETLCPDTFSKYQFVFNYFLKSNPYFLDAIRTGKLTRFVMDGKMIFDSVISVNTKVDYYKYTVIEISLKKVIIEWINGGMQEPPDLMANIFCSLFYKL